MRTSEGRKASGINLLVGIACASIVLPELGCPRGFPVVSSAAAYPAIVIDMRCRKRSLEVRQTSSSSEIGQVLCIRRDDDSTVRQPYQPCFRPIPAWAGRNKVRTSIKVVIAKGDAVNLLGCMNSLHEVSERLAILLVNCFVALNTQNPIARAVVQRDHRLLAVDETTGTIGGPCRVDDADARVINVFNCLSCSVRARSDGDHEFVYEF